MTLEDPFFVVKDEVCKALNKTRGLYQRWGELKQEEASTPVVAVAGSREEQEWTNTELRNALRSIEWDLEDLEETIGIVEKNPRKFKIDAAELSSRKNFIEHTKQEVKSMKERINESRKGDSSTRQSAVDDNSSPLKMPEVVTHGNTRYSRLVNEADSPNSEFIERTLAQQEAVMSQQDEQLGQISNSMGTLKNMSRQIGQEVDEQAVMLDDFGHEMEHTQSKMEAAMSKMAKVMHLTSDRRQWAAIGALSGVLAVVILLYFVI